MLDFTVKLPVRFNTPSLKKAIKTAVIEVSSGLDLIGFETVVCLPPEIKTMARIVANYEKHTFSVELPFIVYPMINEMKSRHTVRHELVHISDTNNIFNLESEIRGNSKLREYSVALRLWSEFYANHMSTELQTKEVIQEFVDREADFFQQLECNKATDRFICAIDLLTHIAYNYGDFYNNDDLRGVFQNTLSDIPVRNSIERELKNLLQLYPDFTLESLSNLKDVARDYIISVM